MRIKECILLACLGLLVPAKVWADVDSLYFQLNQEGEIVNLGSTGADSATGGDEKTETPILRGATKGGTGDPLPACTFNASGETVGDCTCPESGTNEVALTQSGSSYVCCDMTTHKIYLNGSYSKNFMPVCGCLNGYRPPYEGTDQVCCKNGLPWYNSLGADDPTPQELQNNPCGCPADSTKVTYNSEQHCCRGLMDLTTLNSGENNAAVCGCVAGESTCKESLCGNTDGYTWCASSAKVNNNTVAAWCTAAESCASECETKGGFWCTGNNTCITKKTCQAGEIQSTEGECGCVAVCSDEHPELCETQENCEAQGSHRKWCYSNKECEWVCDTTSTTCKTCDATDQTKTCKAGDSCCPEGQQEYFDGKCYPCPPEGELVLAGKNVVCCKSGSDIHLKGQRWKSKTEGESTTFSWGWDTEGLCGCPVGVDEVQGTVGEGGLCCLNNYGWNTQTENYDTFHEACGCPEGGTKSDRDICCKSGKPIQEDGTYSSNRDVTKCGCLSSEMLFSNGSGNSKVEVCCKGGLVKTRTPGSTWTPDEGVCHCTEETMPYYSNGSCGACFNDAQCTDSSAPHCHVDEDDSSHNACVQCLSDLDCPAAKPKCNDSGSCVSCPSGHYQNGNCYECLNDDHCTDGKKCNTSIHQCVSCLPTANTPHTGCTAAAPYCIQEGSSSFCSACRTDEDCTKPQKCRFSVVDGAKVGSCKTIECTKDRECKKLYPDTKEKCDLDSGLCVPSESCGENGELCVCPKEFPVWDIYERKCVHCYDSISEDWTDLGCPDNIIGEGTSAQISGAESIASGTVTDNFVDAPETSYRPWDVNTYDTRAYVGVKGASRICLVSSKSPVGKCVECLKDTHCREGRKCVNFRCECDEKEHYIAAKNKCVECTANEGAIANAANDIYPCPADKPYCDTNSGQCHECNANYGVTGTGKKACKTVAKPICNTSTNVCEACPSDKPGYATTGCVACGEHATAQADGTCKCDEGYGVVFTKDSSGEEVKGKSCVFANLPSSFKKCNEIAMPSCPETGDYATKRSMVVGVWAFTPVDGMKYRIHFHTTSARDYYFCTCPAPVITDGTNKSRDEKKFYYWCSSKENVCPDKQVGGTRSCWESGLTGACPKNVFEFTGAGGAPCGMYIQNGRGGCVSPACTGGDVEFSTVTVAEDSQSYTP